ncbi:MAG: TetR/AcrR family transcriptional regulator [Chloroflexota bacterium]|nr:TetR/AcrR family transcriptional regulator [Chloroflexota bacterium]
MKTVKREYRSPLREASARATRAAIIGAATRLFVEQGYAATSVDAIAEAAGVSRATVFATFGGKAVLLKAAYDVALAGDDEPIPLPERPRSKAVQAEPDPARLLEGYAEILTDISGRLAPIYEAVRGGASADPEAREVWEKIQTERRIGGTNVVKLITARQALRKDLDRESAGDLVWVLNDPGLYFMLVHRRRWSAARFQAWLAQTLKTQLLGR